MSYQAQLERLFESLLERLRSCLVPQPDKPDETPESTLAALSYTAIGAPLSARKAARASLPPLDEPQQKRLLELVDARCSGIPLSHLTGRQNFMGIELLSSPDALIPRVETEILGYEALATATTLGAQRGPLNIADVCTGSGNLILGILAHQPQSRGFASDISSSAIGLARQNARHLNLEEAVSFFVGDLFEPLRSENLLGKFDLITCNPPYISSKKASGLAAEVYRGEPLSAFDGGPFGLSILSKFLNQASQFLRPSSFLCFEIGLGQELLVMRMLESCKVYREITPLTDPNRNTRGFKVMI